MFLKIEAGRVVLAVMLAFKVPRLGSRWFEALGRSFGKLALRLALLPIRPIPAPAAGL